MNKMYLVLGDWSGDGHEKYDKILVEANVPVEDVQKAYKDSCKLTGVSFHDGDEFTQNYTVAVDYEDSTIPNGAMEIFVEGFGLTPEIVNRWECDEEYEEGEPLSLNTDSFVNAWIWFVKLSHPEIQIKTVDGKDEIPCINGFWNDTLNVQFGYGMYH